MCPGAGQAQVHFLPLVGQLAAADGALPRVVGEVARPVVGLDEEGVAGVLYMGGADAHRPVQLCHIGPQVDHRAALVHVQAAAQVGVGVPEILLVRAVEDVPPQGALRLGVGVARPVEVREPGHGHVLQLALRLKLGVVGHAVLVAFQQQLIGSFPPAHLVHPARAHEHHVVAVAVVVFAQAAVLVDQVVEIGVLPGVRVVDHPPQHVLGVGAEVGAVAVKAGQQVPRQVRDGHDAAVLRLVCRRGVGVLFGGDPGVPGAAVEEGVPGVVAGVVGLGALLPAGGHRALDAGVFLLDEVGQVGVQVVAAGGGGVKAELFVEFLEHVGDDGLFVLHGEHPDAEVLRFVLVPELLAGQPQQRQGDLVPVLFMVLLGQRHRLRVEQAGVGHLDGGPDAVLVGDGLLGLEDVQALGKQRLAADVLLFAVTRHLLGVLRHHLRPVDHVQDKAFHLVYSFLCWDRHSEGYIPTFRKKVLEK